MKVWGFSLHKTPSKLMRYCTVGDWYDPVWGDMVIEVADMKNPDYNFLVLLHELIEAYLCISRGITDKKVTGFDTAHPELDDPGASSKAPYHKEHEFATKIEAMMSVELGVNWPNYEKAQEKVMKNYGKKLR